jgi:uncharacterized protein
MADRLLATPAAQALIDHLQAQHGAIYFYLSHGCCDGTSPMCLAPGELPLGPGDVQLGTVGGAAFWLSQGQADDLAHLRLTLDAVPGTNSNFSLEEGGGQRFVLQMVLIDGAAPAG